MIFGLLHKHLHLTGWKETVVGLICTVAALAIGMTMPITLGKDGWTYITFVYIFFAAVLPMWLLKQPRDAMTTYMFIGRLRSCCWIIVAASYNDFLYLQASIMISLVIYSLFYS